ncbi:hypothetical protein RB2654_02035 [Rhodobacterales bacterium HTCC2654]|uniref:Uncharacterized protein n=2 Tax=Roseobacteraceae TaxID=2854170 RepID=A3VJZ6_9RHOB|nr:hypothetical protein RB2654_02035 [Rhodobacterales bacterium HTCC2654] [Maritimibacter alkaliphilus HTCC2654]
MALATAGLAIYVLVEAIITDHLTQQVFYAILPLVLLFSVAWNGLTNKRD